LSKLIAANWKQNGSSLEVDNLTREIIKGAKKLKNLNNLILIPPSVYLERVSKLIKKSSVSKRISLGVQNISPYKNGAYTGEISADMCKDFDCKYFIVGHSERRETFNEDSVMISKKVLNVLNTSQKIILCIGETLNQREKKQARKVIANQIKSGLSLLTPKMRRTASKIIIAYEPVWAIGTGKTPSLQDIFLMHKHIIEISAKIFITNRSIPKILYGGSVNSENSNEILSIQGVDGALVGGASLNAKKFIDICRSI